MARYIGAKCRMCRREGVKLFLKGEKCISAKCTIDKRPMAPGVHGKKRTKLSEYGLQLREKQKAKRFYGMLERQFRNYFEKAEKQSGIVGENFLKLLETRLDNVLYRAGFASSRTESRQIVRHNHVLVNGKKVNIPSYIVKAGDVVSIREEFTSMPRMKELADITASRIIPAWLESNKDKFNVKVLNIPARDQIDVPVQETLIVELYSK